MSIIGLSISVFHIGLVIASQSVVLDWGEVVLLINWADMNIRIQKMWSDYVQKVR